MPVKDTQPIPSVALTPIQRGFNAGLLESATAVMRVRKEYLAAPDYRWSGRQVAAMLERMSLAIGDAFLVGPEHGTTE